MTFLTEHNRLSSILATTSNKAVYTLDKTRSGRNDIGVLLRKGC